MTDRTPDALLARRALAERDVERLEKEAARKTMEEGYDDAKTGL